MIFCNQIQSKELLIQCNRGAWNDQNDISNMKAKKRLQNSIFVHENMFFHTKYQERQTWEYTNSKSTFAWDSLILQIIYFSIVKVGVSRGRSQIGEPRKSLVLCVHYYFCIIFLIHWFPRSWKYYRRNLAASNFPTDTYCISNVWYSAMHGIH